MKRTKCLQHTLRHTAISRDMQCQDVCDVKKLNESNMQVHAHMYRCAMPTKSGGMNCELREMAKHSANLLSRRNRQG